MIQKRGSVVVGGRGRIIKVLRKEMIISAFILLIGFAMIGSAEAKSEEPRPQGGASKDLKQL